MTFSPYIFAALLFAAAAPVALMLMRHELNNVRSSVIEDLKLTVFRNNADLPQLDLAAARYRSASNPQGLGNREYLVQVGSGALVFVATSWCGFSLLFSPIGWLVDIQPRFPSITRAILWTSDTSAPVGAMAGTAIIAGFAFLGAYVVQTQYLTRATLNQELGALTFVRAALDTLTGMIVAIVLYRAAGALMGGEIVPSNPTEHLISAIAIAVAFVVGYQPDLGLARIMKWASAWSKGVDEVALRNSKSVPLEVIDGIDRAVSLRLQESNLYDVQALATVNPIALFAETPFNLYACFDWVLQAQLCLVVGTTGFAALKQHAIRTIFDLERAVLAEGAPDVYVSGVGGVILTNASDAFKQRVGIVAGAGMTPQTARHVVAIMGDDLHVHRLRALWNTIMHATAGTPDGEPHWLFETGALPGEAVDGDLSDPARSAIRLVDAVARELHTAQAAAPPDTAAIAALDARCLAAVTLAAGLDESAKEHLRLLWNPNYVRKRTSENSLESFYNDPRYQALLA